MPRPTPQLGFALHSHIWCTSGASSCTEHCSICRSQGSVKHRARVSVHTLQRTSSFSPHASGSHRSLASWQRELALAYQGFDRDPQMDSPEARLHSPCSVGGCGEEGAWWRKGHGGGRGWDVSDVH